MQERDMKREERVPVERGEVAEPRMETDSPESFDQRGATSAEARSTRLACVAVTGKQGTTPLIRRSACTSRA